MNLIKDLKTMLNRHKANKDSEEELEESLENEDVGNVSMKDGDHGTIFGINRKIVIGIGIFFVTVLCIAFIFSMDNNKSKTEKNELSNQLNQKQDIAPNVNRSDNANLPNSYESLAAMDKKNNKKNMSQAGTQQNQQAAQAQYNAARSRSAATMAGSDTPAIAAAYSNGYAPSVYSQQYALASRQQQIADMPISPEQGEKRSATDKLEDKFKSAIAFAIGSSSNNSISAGQPTASNTDSTNGTPDTSASIAAYNDNGTGGYTAPANNMLITGSIIPVMLLTGVNTDVEGQVMAQIQADIYDSMSGTNLLIPAGSRVVGTYSKNNNGRIGITFNSLIMSDGGTWSIGDSFIAIDGAGYTGIQGKVDHHTSRIISSGMFGSAIAALGSLASGNTSSNNTYTAGQLASQGAMSNLINMTSKMMEKNANVADTVTVEPGYSFNIYVTKNIAF